MVRVISAEGRAALSRARKGKPASPLVIQALEKARASKNPDALVRQAASLSLTMKGRPRTLAQIAAFDAARQKAHSRMLGNTSTRLGTIGLYASVGETLRKRDGDLCQLCLGQIDFTLPLRTSWSRSVDHIIPTRAGGTDDLLNLWLAHTLCNQKKGARHCGRTDGSTDIRR